MPRGPTPCQAIAMNKAEDEMHSTSDIANADDIELQEITENVVRSMENLTVQLNGESSEDLQMHELLGLDKQLKSIRCSLKMEVAKNVQLEEKINKEKRKLEEIQENPEYGNGIKEDIRLRIA